MRQFGRPLGIELMLEEPAHLGLGKRELVGEPFRRGVAAAGQAASVLRRCVMAVHANRGGGRLASHHKPDGLF